MKVEGKLWIDINGLGTAGQVRIRLLELIAETGSINKAAQTIGMSYKGAWDNINTLNQIFGKDLVERKIGGKGGGGTVLTEHGKNLIKTYNHYSRIHELYLTDISLMNCVEAVIASVTPDGYATAKTTGGETIACVLLDSDIKAEDSVNLFIKPSDIILLDSDKFESSARNLLKTKVKSLSKSEGKADIVLTTDKGTTLTVRITQPSAEKMKISKGKEIFALFKTASVLAAHR
jgi:molybdate transport system regulatory protein